MNLTITNHKSTAAVVEVTLNQYYGDNLKVKWTTEGLEMTKESANVYKWKRLIQPDEKFVATWTEDYFP